MAAKKKRFMFIESFKTFDIRFFHAMLFDLIGLLVFFGIAAFYYMYFGRITEAYPLTIQSGTWYMISFIFLSAIAIVLYTLNVSIFKRLVYKYTVEKTQDMKIWFKFSLAWIIPWFIIFVLIIQMVKDEWRGPVIFIFWLLFVMLTAIARTDMQKRIKETVFTAFSKFFKWRTLLAYLLSVVMILVLVLLFGWMYIFGRAAYVSILFLVFLLYSAWARHYLALTIKD